MAGNPPIPPDPPPTWAAWAISIVNGMVGDYLHDRRNGLCIDMAFYHRNRPVHPGQDAWLHMCPQPTARICILVHGLACNEGIWWYADPRNPLQQTNYGAQLQADLGYTPLFVRYNTGLAIAENGRALATLLDELLAWYPVPIEEIVLIGHSMGGLVARSACHLASERQDAWVALVRRVFYLGMPHEGAPLAQLSHTVAGVLQGIPNPITRLLGDIFNLRSQGIKDLRSSVEHHHQPEHEAHEPPVLWIDHAHHHIIVGTVVADPTHPAAVLLGDGLVTVPDRHPQMSGGTGRAGLSSHIQLIPGLHHLALAGDQAVYAHIYTWCQALHADEQEPPDGFGDSQAASGSH